MWLRTSQLIYVKHRLTHRKKVGALAISMIIQPYETKKWERQIPKESLLSPSPPSLHHVLDVTLRCWGPQRSQKALEKNLHKRGPFQVVPKVSPIPNQATGAERPLRSSFVLCQLCWGRWSFALCWLCPGGWPCRTWSWVWLLSETF